MNKTKYKLVMLACVMLVSLVLLVTASFAWYSISTSPEITGLQVTLFTDRALLVSRDGEDYDQAISLTDKFKYYASLKPISTVDGVHWFTAEYGLDTTGSITGNFLLNTDGGNVGVYKKDANGNYTDQMLTGEAYFNANNRGYYVYCDFWLATELEEGCNVTLSAPDLSLENLEKWEEDAGRYGSYALAAYALQEDGTAATIDNNAQTALRVGFMIYDEAGNPARFVIYEPNADQRGDPKDKPAIEDEYVQGFGLIENPAYDAESNPNVPMYLNYIDGTYIPTYPIGIVKKQVDTDGDGTPDTERESYEPVEIDPEDLIIQKRGYWNETAENFMERAKRGVLNSNDILKFGRFVWDNTKLAVDETTGIYTFPTGDSSNQNTDLASSSIIVSLKGRDENGVHGQRITMYIWLEGQDADCWNDIADGTFAVNLEFAAQ